MITLDGVSGFSLSRKFKAPDSEREIIWSPIHRQPTCMSSRLDPNLNVLEKKTKQSIWKELMIKLIQIIIKIFIFNIKGTFNTFITYLSGISINWQYGRWEEKRIWFLIFTKIYAKKNKITETKQKAQNWE